MSVAADGWTEAILYFANGKMQTNDAGHQKREMPE